MDSCICMTDSLHCSPETTTTLLTGLLLYKIKRLKFQKKKYNLNKKEFWSGLPFSPPGDLPDPLLHWQVDSLTLMHLGSKLPCLYLVEGHSFYYMDSK